MSAASGRVFRARNPWYDLYRNAKRRCEDPKQKSYKYVGGRGIKFRMSMQEVIELFIRDDGYSLECPSLDRKDASKDYTFDNCRVIEKHINERIPHEPDLAEAVNQEWTD